jgi:hypothetical protein
MAAKKRISKKRNADKTEKIEKKENSNKEIYWIFGSMATLLIVFLHLKV